MRKGEIWLARLDPTVGDEIGKTRPVAVVSDDEVGILRLKVIVPITAWNDLFPPLIGWCSSNRHQKMAWLNSPPPTLFKFVLSRNKDLSDRSEFCPIQLWKIFQKHWQLFWIWIE